MVKILAAKQVQTHPIKKCENVSSQKIIALQNKSTRYFQDGRHKKNGSLKEIENDTSENGKKLIKLIA